MATTGSTFSLSQNLTGSAPTLATEGQALEDLKSVSVVVETATPATQTLSGAGSLLCYVYDGATGGPGAWSRHPAGDFTVTLSGVARQSFEPVEVLVNRKGRVLWVPSGVTVSAGATVTVYQLGQAKLGAY